MEYKKFDFESGKFDEKIYTEEQKSECFKEVESDTGFCFFPVVLFNENGISFEEWMENYNMLVSEFDFENKELLVKILKNEKDFPEFWKIYNESITESINFFIKNEGLNVYEA